MAPDVENVRQVLAGMQGLLGELKQQKVTDSAAKQKCDEQMYRLAEGQAAADASLSLLGAAKDHLHITASAAKTVCTRVLSSEESGALTMIEQLASLFQNVQEL